MQTENGTNVQKKRETLPKIFYIYYFAVFMGLAIFNSFFSTFFANNGMSSGQIGLLFGLAPLAGLIAQPVWGALTDRARTKNTVLCAAIVGVMASIVLFYVISRFFSGAQAAKLLLLSGAMIVFSLFNNALIPLQDTITLDYIVRHGGRYGAARMSGTIGYAITALCVGMLLSAVPDSVFTIYFFVLCFILLCALRLPKAHGYRKKGEQGSILEVLRDKEILLVLLLCLVQYIALSFGHTFCGPYMLSLGGNSTWIGAANMVQAVGEIPFHLKWGRRLIDRIGIHRILIAATVFGALRWAITAVCKSPLLFAIVTGMEGFMLVPMIVGVVEFVNGRVPHRLKATAQTAITLSSSVLSRTIGNIGGGALVDLFNSMGYNGMSLTYGLLVPLSLIAAAAIGIPLLHCAKKSAANSQTTCKGES